jgi:hypothetical protein
MSSRNSPTLTLDLRTRSTEQRVAGLALVAAAWAVMLLDGAPAAQVLGAAGMAAVAWGLWRAGWIGSRHRIATVRWLSDGRWLLADGRGNAFSGELSADTRRFRDIVWLRWKTGPGRRRSVLLTPRDLPAGELRGLAVRLQIEAPTGVPVEVLERALPEAAPR